MLALAVTAYTPTTGARRGFHRVQACRRAAPAVCVARAMMRTLFIAALLLLGSLSSGCVFGPQALKADQVDYGRALGEAKKREILSTVVGLRYADTPGFLDVTQIIASYNFDAGTVAQVNAAPDPGGPRAGVSGTVTYSNHPTFTFTPTAGDNYAKTYIHPLSPAQILPLAQTGVPIDLLLRIAVQSLGGHANASMLGGPSGNGSPEFFELIHLLRRLQLDGAVGIHFEPENSQQLVVSLKKLADTGPAANADTKRLRFLLHLAPDANEFKVVTTDSDPDSHSISVMTRSLLAILTDLSAEIDIPAEDIESGATQPAVRLVGGETRPVLMIHSGKPPRDAYASIRYRGHQFWIANTDFDTKYALTVVQSLEAVAQVSDNSHAPVVTVPAR
jgi:hypothetical protein